MGTRLINELSGKKAGSAPKPPFVPEQRRIAPLIDGFVPQDTPEVKKKLQLTQTEAIKLFLKLWEECNEKGLFGDIRKNQSLIVAGASKNAYSASDIYAFSLVLKDLDIGPLTEDTGRKMGLFVTALINGCPGNEFTIQTSELGFRLDNFGYQNRKNIRVVGNLRYGAAMEMERGTLTVEGNVGDNAGFFQFGGRLVVQGNAGRSTGFNIFDAEIIVHGNTEDDTGYMMGFILKPSELEKARKMLLGDGESGKSGTSPLVQNEVRPVFNGKIIVFGNTGYRTGDGMFSGEIIVHGNTGAQTGNGMIGGTIRVLGKIGGLGHRRGGEVYEKGELMENPPAEQEIKALSTRTMLGWLRDEVRKFFEKLFSH